MHHIHLTIKRLSNNSSNWTLTKFGRRSPPNQRTRPTLQNLQSIPHPFHLSESDSRFSNRILYKRTGRFGCCAEYRPPIPCGILSRRPVLLSATPLSPQSTLVIFESKELFRGTQNGRREFGARNSEGGAAATHTACRRCRGCGLAAHRTRDPVAFPKTTEKRTSDREGQVSGVGTWRTRNGRPRTRTFPRIGR